MIDEAKEMATKADIPLYEVTVDTEDFGFDFGSKRLTKGLGDPWKINDFLKLPIVQVRWSPESAYEEMAVGDFAKKLCKKTGREYVKSTEYTLDKERSAFRATELYEMLEYPFFDAFLALEYRYETIDGLLSLSPAALMVVRSIMGSPTYTDYMKLSMFHRYLGQKTYTTDIDYIGDGIIWEFKQKRPMRLGEPSKSEQVLWNFADMCGYEFLIAYCTRDGGDFQFDIPYLCQVVKGVESFKRYKHINRR
jgi:hypothetical protein